MERKQKKLKGAVVIVFGFKCFAVNELMLNYITDKLPPKKKRMPSNYEVQHGQSQRIDLYGVL